MLGKYANKYFTQNDRIVSKYKYANKYLIQKDRMLGKYANKYFRQKVQNTTDKENCLKTGRNYSRTKPSIFKIVYKKCKK